MRCDSETDFDEYVQFWIDLIQSRAPGSSMIVVGTHMDEVSRREKVVEISSHKSVRWSKGHGKKKRRGSESTDKIDMLVGSLKTRLDKNEANRLKALNSKIESETNNVAELKNLRKLRPNLVAIVPVSCVQDMKGFSKLTETILHISTPSKSKPNPFQLVNITVPSYWLEVKAEVELMIREENVTSMQELDRKMRGQTPGETSRTIKHTRDAVAFLSSVGEVCGNKALF